VLSAFIHYLWLNCWPAIHRVQAKPAWNSLVTAWNSLPRFSSFKSLIGLSPLPHFFGFHWHSFSLQCRRRRRPLLFCAAQINIIYCPLPALFLPVGLPRSIGSPFLKKIAKRNEAGSQGKAAIEREIAAANLQRTWIEKDWPTVLLLAPFRYITNADNSECQ
jgi:hypothetical protein